MDLVFPTEHGVFNYRVAGIFVKDGHVLIHRNVRDDFWALPGGRVTLGEEAATALARELYEELNMRVTDTSFAFVHENLFTYNDQPFHEIGLYFYVDGDLPLQDGDFYGPEGDHLIYRWQKLDRLQDVTLYPEVLAQLPNRLPAHSLNPA